MLKALRKNTKVIIWTVIVSFMLWGGFSIGVQFQKQGRVAGEVFGKAVSFQEYNNFYRASEIFSMGGQQPNQDPDFLKMQTWQSIIYSKEAKREKINVSDEEVRQEIARLLEAQKITNPTTEIYRGWLMSTIKETPQEFELQIRELLRVQKLITQIRQKQTVAPVSRDEAYKLYLQEGQKFSAEFLTFPNFLDANAFYEKAKNAEGWKKETVSKASQIKKVDLTSTKDWVQTWGMPEEKATEILTLKKDSLLKPVALGKQFAVFHLLEIEPASEEKFNKDFKDKLTQQITEEKKYAQFLQWTRDLRQKANLKDYIPGAPQSS